MSNFSIPSLKIGFLTRKSMPESTISLAQFLSGNAVRQQMKHLVSPGKFCFTKLAIAAPVSMPFYSGGLWSISKSLNVVPSALNRV